MVDLTKQQDREKITWLMHRYKEAENFCRPYFERAKRHYRLYRFGSAVDKDKWPYVNRVRSRDILAFVEDSTATMVQSLLGTYPFYSVIPRRRSQAEQQYGIDSIKIGQQIEKVLNYQISNEDTEFLEEQVDFFKEGGIFGTSYEGIYPRFVNKRYVGPLIKTIGFWDCLPIPGARRASKSRGIFVREYLTPDEIMKAGAFQNGDDMKRMLTGGTWNIEKWHQDLMAQLGLTQWAPDSSEIEILHYFSGGNIISMANRSFILRDSSVPQPETGLMAEPFPFSHPIVQYKYMPLPQEWFGMGIPEVLEVLQEDKNLIRSARRDNIDLIINKIIKARAGSDLNYDLFKYYPGAVWPMENLSDVETLEQGDVTQSSYKEEEVVRFDMENSLSMFGYARGMTPTHEERPTTVIKLQQAAMNRIDLSVKLAEFTTLQQIANRVILLTRRYMAPSDYEAICGEPDAGFFKLPESAISLFFHLKPMGSSITHIKEIRQQQLMGAFDLLGKLGPISMSNIQPFTIDWLEAARSTFEALDIKNTDQILIPVKQPPPQVPPGEDISKVFPYIARYEQMQALMKMGIQPDANARFAGLPNADSMIKLQSVQYGRQGK